MGWVVDRAVQATRDMAMSGLTRAVGQGSYAAGRCRTVEGGTRTAMGHGHPDGDRIVRDATQATECLQNAQSSILAAIAQLGQVDIMKWEPNDDD